MEHENLEPRANSPAATAYRIGAQRGEGAEGGASSRRILHIDQSQPVSNAAHCESAQVATALCRSLGSGQLSAVVCTAGQAQQSLYGYLIEKVVCRDLIKQPAIMSGEFFRVTMTFPRLAKVLRSSRSCSLLGGPRRVCCNITYEQRARPQRVRRAGHDGGLERDRDIGRDDKMERKIVATTGNVDVSLVVFPLGGDDQIFEGFWGRGG